MPDPTPPDTALSSLKANVDRGFTALIDAFVIAGFPRKEARLWVGAWRHRDQPTDLARFALAARRLGIPVSQAIPWYWERIPAHVAVKYLLYRWRAADARRVATALRRRDPSLTRNEGLREGLAWAMSYRSGDESLAFITLGYTLRQADTLELSLAFAHLDHKQGKPGGPSTAAEWLASGIPPTWAVRYTAAGIHTVDEALTLDQQRLADPDGFRQALDVIQALGGDE